MQQLSIESMAITEEVAMIDFIVLGLVPGTSIQLTFGDVVRILSICALAVLLAINLRHLKSRKSFRLDSSDIEQMAL